MSKDMTQMPEEQRNFYRHLSEQIERWIERNGKDHQYADYLLYAPDLLHLLCKLSVDEDMSTSSRAKLAAAIAYFISPVDVVPEAVLGPAGYIDDIAVAAHVVSHLMTKHEDEVIRRHWSGDDDLLYVLQRIQETAVEVLGGRIWNTTKRVLGTEAPSSA